jgi:hypothetical protein
MNSSLSENREYRLIAFHPAYENVHALLAEIHLYVFGQDGRLVESQAVRRDKVVVAVTDDELRGAKIVIAPPLEAAAGGPLTLSLARDRHIFEIDLCFDSAQSSYALPPVPEVVWRWWLVHSLWESVREISAKKTGLPRG